jgi:hypothetical protein
MSVVVTELARTSGPRREGFWWFMSATANGRTRRFRAWTADHARAKANAWVDAQIYEGRA